MINTNTAEILANVTAKTASERDGTGLIGAGGSGAGLFTGSGPAKGGSRRLKAGCGHDCPPHK